MRHRLAEPVGKRGADLLRQVQGAGVRTRVAREHDDHAQILSPIDPVGNSVNVTSETVVPVSGSRGYATAHRNPRARLRTAILARGYAPQSSRAATHRNPRARLRTAILARGYAPQSSRAATHRNPRARLRTAILARGYAPQSSRAATHRNPRARQRIATARSRRGRGGRAAAAGRPAGRGACRDRQVAAAQLSAEVAGKAAKA
ncbi:hypothetical protein GCM10027610_140000 [Dactylosporangium cerinum]